MNEQTETMEQSMDSRHERMTRRLSSPIARSPYQYVDRSAGGMCNLWPAEGLQA